MIAQACARGDTTFGENDDEQARVRLISRGMSSGGAAPATKLIGSAHLGMPFPLRRKSFPNFRDMEEWARSLNVQVRLRTSRPPKNSTASEMPFLTLSVAGVDVSMMADAEVALPPNYSTYAPFVKRSPLARGIHAQVAAAGQDTDKK